jgi:hypothetical protein
MSAFLDLWRFSSNHEKIIKWLNVLSRGAMSVRNLKFLAR